MGKTKEEEPEDMQLTPGQLELIQNMVGRPPTELEMLVARRGMLLKQRKYPKIHSLFQEIGDDASDKDERSKQLSAQIGNVYADVRETQPENFDPDVVAVLTGGVYNDVVERIDIEHMIRQRVPNNAVATTGYVLVSAFSMAMGAVATNAAVRGDAKMFAAGLAFSALGAVNAETVDWLRAGRCRIAVKDFLRYHFPPVYSARAMREVQEEAYGEGLAKGADIALEAVVKSGRVFHNPISDIDVPPHQPGERVH
jgi:hypothetical protein